MASTFEIRHAERRDLAALSALAQAQAAARQALDPRLPAAPHIIPFLSQAETLDEVLSWRHHVTFVARRDGQVAGGINLHRIEQSDRDQFAAYYPRHFTSIGLIAAQGDGAAAVLADLLSAARAQAARWKSGALLAHNASADLTVRAALEAFGFRMFYYYALRPAIPPGGAPAPAEPAAPPRTDGVEAGAAPNAVEPPSAPIQTPGSAPGDPAAARVFPPEHGPVDVPAMRYGAPAGGSTAVAAEPHTSQGAAIDRIQPMPGGGALSAGSHPQNAPLDGLSVRHATTADLDDVVELGLESVRYHATLEPVMHVPRAESAKMRHRFQEILREPHNGALFVAMLDWQVVGFYSLYLQSIDDSWTPPLFAPGRYGLIAEVAVAEGLRGRGIGRLLFQSVETWFRERGARRFWLIYLPRNPLSSRFWPSLGFQPVWDVMLSAA